MNSDAVLNTLRTLAARNTPPMEATRTAVSMLSATDTAMRSVDWESTLRAGRRIVSLLLTIWNVPFQEIQIENYDSRKICSPVKYASAAVTVSAL